jgi:RNA polymerase sigma factor (TIGR02999 family)
MTAPESTMTRLLEQLRGGDPHALNRLVPLVYDELRVLARRHRSQWHGDETLGTTALVNEAYLKLARQRLLDASSRAHFLAIAAMAMRQILTNYAERRRRLKRGGEQHPVTLDDVPISMHALDVTEDEVDSLAALNTALARLDRTNGRLARVVECRFFGGLSVADTATALEISPATVKRDWLLARAWLARELAPHRNSAA